MISSPGGVARLNFAPRVAGPVAQLYFDGSRRPEGAHLTCLQSKQHNNILRSYYESSESLSDEPYATSPDKGAGAGAAPTRRRFSTGAGPSSTLFFTRGATTTDGAGAFAASARNARTATSSAAFA